MAESTTSIRQVRRYPGVESFADSEVHRKLFYGRKDEIYDLRHLILAERLVVLFARSGIGKTSIINAGLMQPLREKGLFPIVVRVTGANADPMDSFYQGVKAACDQGVQRREIDAYEPEVANDWNKTSLWHFIKTFYLWRDDKLLQPVIIIDQFEELFTLISEDRRKVFIDQLADLVRGTRPRISSTREEADGLELTDRSPEVKVVLSIREDFMAHLEEMAERIPAILKSRFRLGPLGTDQARLAIVEPSQLDSPGLTTPRFAWSDDALQCALDFLCRRKSARGETEAGDEVEPFQLQLICQFVEDLVLDKKLDLVRVEDLGGEDALERILARFYEDSIDQLCHRFPGFRVRRRLETLCEYGLITSKGRRLLREESTINESNRISPEILAAMVGLRLIRKEPRVGDNYYELSHDTLIAPILENREYRESKRKLWYWTAGVMASVGMISVAIFMLFQLANKQRELEAARLATEAQMVMQKSDTGTSLIQSALLATASLQQTRTLPGYLAWANSVKLLPRGRSLLMDLKSTVSKAVFSTNGGRLATAGEDGPTVRLWDTQLATELDDLVQEAPVDAIVLSTDGTRLVTVSADGNARLWDTQSGVELASLGRASIAALNADGTRLVTASADDGNALLWDTQSIVEPANLGPASIVALNADGTRVATLSEEDGMRLWDTQRMHQPKLMKPEPEALVYNSVFSADGKRLATVDYNGGLRLWDAEIGEKLNQSWSEDYVNTMVLSTDGDRLATASADVDYTVRLWKDEELVRLTHKDLVSDMVFSPDGTLLATASEDGRTVRLWDTRYITELDITELARLPIDTDSVRAMIFWTDGTRLATVSDDGTAWLWDTQSGAESVAPFEHEDAGSFVVFNADGTRFVTVNEDGTGLLRDTQNGVELASLGPVVDMTFSTDGGRVATAGGATDAPSVVRLWDAKSGAELKDLKLEADRVTLNGDGTRLVAADADGKVRLWDTGSDENPLLLPNEGGSVSAMVLNADGTLLATADEDGKVWLRRTGSDEKPLPLAHDGDSVSAMIFNTDGTQLAVASGDAARLFDAQSGKKLLQLKHQGVVNAVVFSTDERNILTASEDRTARLFDVQSGEELLRLNHQGAVNAVVFSTDERNILTASEDHTARLFDAQSGEELLQLGHPNAVKAVAFSADERHLLTMSENGVARKWWWRVDDLIAEGCRRLPRNFTRSEWDRYFPNEKAYRKICSNQPPGPAKPEAEVLPPESVDN